MFESANEMQVETGLEAEPLSYSVRKSSSGALVEESNWGSHVQKKVTFPNAPYYDHSLTADRMEHMTEGIREAKKKMQQQNSNTPIYTCDNREPDGDATSTLAFLPVFAGEVTESSPTASFEGECFD